MEICNDFSLDLLLLKFVSPKKTENIHPLARLPILTLLMTEDRDIDPKFWCSNFRISDMTGKITCNPESQDLNISTSNSRGQRTCTLKSIELKMISLGVKDSHVP